MTECVSDKLLLPYLTAQDPRAVDAALCHLVEQYATPIINTILHNRFLGRGPAGFGHAKLQDADEIRQDVKARLVVRLDAARTGRMAPVSDFRAYVAATAANVLAEFLRSRYPQRHSLESRARFALERNAALSLVRHTDGRWIAGLAARPFISLAITSRAELLERDPVAALEHAFHGASPRSMPLGECIYRALKWLRAPIAWGTLIDAMAAVLNEVDEPGAAPLEALDLHKHNGHNQADAAIARLDLDTLWQRISRFPPTAAAAVLLQCRDANGNSLCELLWVERIATLEEMASALEWPPRRLADLWRDLPLDDCRIAEITGVRAAYVARLRMFARRTLSQLGQDTEG